MNASLQALVWTFFTQIFNFASGAVVARLLGASERGEFAHISAWFSFTIPVLLIGVNDAATYYTAHLRRPASSVYSASLLCAASTIAAGLAVGLLLRQTAFTGASDAVQLATLVFLAYVPVYHLSQISISLLIATGSRLEWNIARSAVPPLYVTLIFVCWLTGHDGLVGITVAYISAMAISLAFASVVLIRKCGVSAPDWRLSGNLFSYGIYAVPQRLTIVCRDNIDRIILPTVVSMADLGNYVVAAATAYLVFLVGYTLDMVAFPTIAKTQPGEERKATTKRFTSSVILLSTVATLGLLALERPIISLVFGPTFEDAKLLASYLTVAGGFLGVNQVLSAALKATGHVKALSLVNMLYTASLVLGFAIVPRWFGTVGGCYVHLAAAVVFWAVQITLVSRLLEIPILDLIRPSAGDFRRVVQSALRR